MLENASKLFEIIFSYPISWIITAVLFILYYTFRQRQQIRREKAEQA